MINGSRPFRQSKIDLMDSFWSLYRNNGIRGVTVKRICEKAGYNRSTFYEYFTDVHDLLHQLEDEVMPNVSDLPLLEGADSSDAMLNMMISMYEKNRDYLKMLLGENGDPAFIARLKREVKVNLKSRLLLLGVTDAFELDLVLEYAVSAMLGVITYYFSSESRPPIQDLYKWLSCISTEGVFNSVVKLRQAGKSALNRV